MTKFHLEDFTYQAQIKILAAQDNLDQSAEQHRKTHLMQLNLPLKENDISFPLVKVVHFVLKNNGDGTKSYVFSHAESSESI